MSASSALQAAIYAALQADAALAALVGDRIHDVPPDAPTYPYVSLGPTSYFPERQDCFRRRVETVQVDVWTRDAERRQPAKAIMDAVNDALDMARLSLANPYGLARMELRLARMIDDPDGITRHGVLQFECEVAWDG